MLPQRIHTLSELMAMERSDQLRYRYVEKEDAYVLQPGRVVGDKFLPEYVSADESALWEDLEEWRVLLKQYYTYNSQKRRWYLLEADEV